MSADFQDQVTSLQLYAARAVTASTEKRDEILADVALLRKCDTAEELAEITEKLRKINAYRADVREEWQSYANPVFKLKQAIDEVAREHLEPINEERNRLHRLTIEFHVVDNQRIARENDLRRQEQERIERERLAREREAQRIMEEAARKEREAAEAIERAKRDAELASSRASAAEAARIRAEAKALEDAAKAKADAERAKAEAEAAEIERVARLNAEMDAAKVATPVMAAKVPGQTAKPEIDFQVIDAAALYQVLPHAFELKERRSVIKTEILSGRISMTNCPRGLRIFETMRVVTRRESKPQQPTIDV